LIKRAFNNLDSETWRSLSIVLSAMALWLLTHPYTGFDFHDTRIYTVLALHWLSPEAYARDPFFMFGSQDSLSLFSPIYGTLIKWLGLSFATMFILLSGAFLWLLAAVQLANRLLDHPLARATSILSMTVIALNFSPNGNTFFLNEAFATARSWAFPLGALAIGVWLGKNKSLAWGLALVTLLIHPLIGIFVITVGFVLQLPDRLGLLAALLSTMLLVVAGVSKLGVFSWFDPLWVDFIREHARDVLVGKRGEARYDAALFYLSLCCLAARTTTDNTARRLYLWVALLSGTGFAVAMFASYWAPAKLLVQAQLWRGMWLAALLSPFAALQIFFFLWRYRHRSLGGDDAWYASASVWIALGGTALLLMLTEIRGCVLSVVCFLGWFSSRHLSTSLSWLQSHVPFLRVAMGGLILLALPRFWVEQQIVAGTLGFPQWPAAPEWFLALLWGIGGPGFIALAGLFVYANRSASLVASICLLVVASSVWDTRTERDIKWAAQMDSGSRGELGRLIKPGDVVLWGRRMPVRAWYELGTAHYASPTQAVGFVFSLAKAEELLRRTALIRAAHALEQDEKGQEFLAREEEHNPDAIFGFFVPISKSAIMKLCQDAQLDWVIVDANQASTTDVAVVYDAIEKQYVEAHSCARYRALGAQG